MSAVPTLREWQRFTPAQRLARYAVYLAVVMAVVGSLRHVEVIPEFLLDAPEQMRDLLQRMWPIAWSWYPRGVHEALVETLHIATLGTLLAVAMALPIGVAAAPNVVRSRVANAVARLLLVSSRSVNSLVWALLFVAVFGPGALAGTLAIAFRSIGFVGKLIGEALEETQRGSLEALEAAGAPLLVRAQDGLGIAGGTEDVAEILQLLAQLDVVVDLAVEDEAEVGEFVDERLIGGGGEVDDGEAGVAEADTWREIGAIAVWAAVAQRGDHGLNLARGHGLAAGAHDARDTAHRSCILPESAASVSGRMVPAGTATG